MASRRTALILNDTVIEHSRPDFTALRPDWSVADALEHMRANPPGGRVVYIYVTDAEGKLLGVVPTRRLLLSQPETSVADLMIRQVIALPKTATVLDACEFFTLHRLLAFPIVDENRKLIGVIDVELYTDELTGELGEEGDRTRIADEIFELIGVHLTESQQASPVKAFGGRFPWLLCNIAGGLLAALLSGFFDDVLTLRGAVYALFIPVVLALAESVAMQSVTLTVSRLRSGTIPTSVLVRRGLIEGTTGGLLGVGASAIVAGVAAVWLGDVSVAVSLVGAVGLGVMLSAMVGFAVPTLLHKFRRNPQVAAGPVALAAADMLTLLVYFNLGRALG